MCYLLWSDFKSLENFRYLSFLLEKFSTLMRSLNGSIFKILGKPIR
ncbi:hypothetical protein PRO82_000020 [Candidatus Protochlamydia amoebophila]|nr:hypothetical protein [Candidatus Protochlamydia amoebophila]